MSSIENSNENPSERLLNTELLNTVEKSNSKLREILEFIKTLVYIVIIAIIIRASVVEAFKIPSASMVPTLQIGDHIFVWKLSYGFRIPFMKKMLYRYGQPERNDIVVFTRVDDLSTREDESSINIIKRVIGLPGDKVQVKDRTVFINDVPTKDKAAIWSEGGTPDGEFGPAVVPEGKILLLGDNRDHSKDSRFWNDPFLPIENVKGRAFLVYWSTYALDRIGTVIR